jgi:hypothetical protein
LSTIIHKKYITSPRASNLAAYFLASRIARGKFSQLKEQAKENLAIAGQSAKPFQNSEKVSSVSPINTTKELAAELKTSDQTASRIIQIQSVSNKL